MGCEVLPRGVGAPTPKARLPTELLDDGTLWSVSPFSNSALLSEYPRLYFMFLILFDHQKEGER